MTTAERKAGKHERIRKMVEKLQAEQAKIVKDEQLIMLLGGKKEKQ